jgi:hypothetical protein
MVSVSVAGITPKARANYIRAKCADHSDHVAEGDVMAAPHLEGLVGGLGKSEICHPGEALLHPVVAVGGQQFQGAYDAQFIEEIAANGILPTLAAVQRELEDIDSVSAGFQGQHAAVFVVRVRRGVHQAGCGAEAAQR